MAKPQHQANINVLISSLIWGLTLSLVIWTSRWFLTDGRLFDILWRGDSVLALVLYPLLVSIILYRKIHLWVNVFLFSAAGSILSSMGMFLFSAFQNKAWTDIGLGVIGIVLISQLLIPKFEQISAVQREWGSPLWEKLNDSSLTEFLSFQFYSIGDNVD
jgi:hypothetical protein